MNAPIRYLLVTHIPFARRGDMVELDALWLRDLEGLRDSVGHVTVAAPVVAPDELRGWGPGVAAVTDGDTGLDFVGFPCIRRRRDWPRWRTVRRVLHDAVAHADLVHTSNCFPPYLGLSYAHDVALRMGKKTLFVIAEDFVDMLSWEWCRLSEGRVQHWRRMHTLRRIDRRVRRCVASASLTFLHTPAVVRRYRLTARNATAIRMAGHELCDVIDERAFAAKCHALLEGERLIVVAAGRHSALKGFDLLIMAAVILQQRGVDLEVRIYGEGAETARLKLLATRLKVAERVTLPGGLPPGRAIFAAVAQGHLFAMPHRTTDFGRAFFDAMVGGTPVVAFRTEASLDTVREGVDGWLCALDDPEELAALLERLDRDRPGVVAAAVNARERALREPRNAWFDLRAQAIRGLFEEARR